MADLEKVWEEAQEHGPQRGAKVCGGARNCHSRNRRPQFWVLHDACAKGRNTLR